MNNNLNYINEKTKIGNNFKCGKFVIIENDVEIGNDVQIGNYTRIMPGTIIGNNVQLMDYVKLMERTIIGNNCKLDDYVNTSGHVIIGNNVRIKRCSMIGQAVKIDDGAWIGSGVTTTRLKNPLDKNCKEEWIHIKSGAMIGSKVLLLAGITVGEGAIIAAGSVVSKDCKPFCIYKGPSAKLYKTLDGENII